MESKKADLIIDCKDDTTYMMVSYYFFKAFNNETVIPDGQTEAGFVAKIKRTRAHLWDKLQSSLFSFSKTFKEQITNGQIKLTIDVQDKGGVIIINMSGTKAELKEWTKINLFNRSALKSLKRWLSISTIFY
ncbi:hypothetical protein GQ473_02535 [archaeon]|nr:hypothetical protein [archaeon]